MSKHSSGPWFRGEEHEGMCTVGNKDGVVFRIEDGMVFNNHGFEEKQANRSVAVAAVELLEACKAMRDCGRRGYICTTKSIEDEDAAISLIEAAIAKAEV